MAEPFCVELARPADAWEALEALEGHGLVAEIVSREGRWEIEVAGGTVEEASHALDDWLAARGLPFVPMRVGARRLTLRPPAE